MAGVLAVRLRGRGVACSSARACIGTVCDALLRARRPRIVAGEEVLTLAAGDPLSDPAGEMEIAVAATLTCRGAIPDDDPLAVDVIGYDMEPNAMTHGVRDWIREVNVILLVGMRTNQDGATDWILFRNDAILLHFDTDQAHSVLAVCTDGTPAIAASRGEFAETVDTFARAGDRPLRPETGAVGYQQHAEIIQFDRPTSAVTHGSADDAAHPRAAGTQGVAVSTRAQLKEGRARSVGSPRTVVLDVITERPSYPPITRWDAARHLHEALAVAR